MRVRVRRLVSSSNWYTLLSKPCHFSRLAYVPDNVVPRGTWEVNGTNTEAPVCIQGAWCSVNSIKHVVKNFLEQALCVIFACRWSVARI